MLVNSDHQIEMEIHIEDTEHLNNLKNFYEKQSITDQQSDEDIINPQINQIDREFQKLLSNLTETKVSENTIQEIFQVTQKLSPKLVLQLPKGPQILYAFYQILSARKSSFQRNFPFSPIAKALHKIKKLLKGTKNLIFKKLGLKKQKEINNKHQVKMLSSFQPYISLKEKDDELAESITRQPSIETQKEPILKPVKIIQGQGLIKN